MPYEKREHTDPPPDWPKDGKKERKGSVIDHLIPHGDPHNASGNKAPGTENRRRKTITPRDIARVEKVKEMLELRKAGMGMEAIAKRVGYSTASSASKAIRQALRLTLKESAEELVTLEGERLDSLFTAQYPKALKGDWRATEMCLRIMQRRSELLGLDQPAQIQVDSETRHVTLSLDATDPATRTRLHELLRGRPGESQSKELPAGDEEEVEDAELVEDEDTEVVEDD